MARAETEKQDRVTPPLPWFYTIKVGSQASAANDALTSLLAGYQYYHFTETQKDDVLINGFAANFAQTDVVIRVSDTGAERAMSPRLVPARALIGEVGQAFGGWLPLPLCFRRDANGNAVLDEPYLLRKGHQLKFEIHNVGAVSLGNTQITVVGQRWG